MQSVRIAIDIGGTFTDFVVEDAGRRRAFKLLTTPDAPADALLAGIDRILATMDVAPRAIAAVLHGTTLATNAVIERRGARVAFLTTAGFRDTLEMGYEHRYDQYNLLIDRTPPLVERRWRFPVVERVAADGAVLTALDAAGVAALAETLRAQAIEAVAIGFLHAYRNAAHERQAAAILQAALPGLPVCLSSEVSPEIREYERFSTVVANAYVRPLMAGYLSAVRDGLAARGIAAPLLLLQSNGGLSDLDSAMRFPVRLLESGPAGGAVFAASVAAELGIADALLLDVGGTTAKLCFIDAGRPYMARSMEIARVDRFHAGSGLPLRLPVVELCEIGAGGGSLARVDALGRLQVGPRSAGAVPGPACYGRGASQPTVTDAHLLLDRLDAQGFAGGAIRLDRAAATAAMTEAVAAPLGLEARGAAWGVLAVVNEAMANAAREHAIDADRALTGRVLIAIGGGGGLHATELASALGIDRVVVPRDSGVGSAVGFLRAPVAFERALSWPETVETMDPVATRAVVVDLMGRTANDVRATGLRGEADIVTSLSAQIRYFGQGSELTVPVDPGDLDAPDFPQRLLRAFEATYVALYRRTLRRPMEIVAWTARSEYPVAVVHAAAATTERPDLGEVLAGPCIVTDAGATIAIPAGWTATVSHGGHRVLARNAVASQAQRRVA